MENSSGYEPIEFKVLVKPVRIEEKTKGGIILPEQTREKDKFAQQEGVLIAVSPDAFTWDGNQDWLKKPRIGDSVIYDRYAGCTIKGLDGEEYRLINDKEIGAIVRR